MSSRGISKSLPKPSTAVAGPPTRNTSLSLEPGAVYVTVFSMAKKSSYHWAIVVATSNRSGIMYHNTNQGAGFYFEPYLHPHLLNSASFLAAIKVSTLTSYTRDFHTHFLASVKEVPVEGRTCRTWVLDALYEQGLIGLQPNKAKIIEIETEVLNYAMAASGPGNRNAARTVVASRHFTA
ncbi:hypothetical protein FQN49_006053 [Arthroderma sp. PD_2]|nr:hypothetical protein FQN49_006053 [Arthroderma sp. PD_2]